MKKLKIKKFNSIKVELFLVEEMIGLINIGLQLLANAHIYLNFHLSIIELVDQNISLQKTFHY